ncbi:hypothetical protein ACFWMH_27335 [Streptomyces tendae]|uniref:hypothetical protein n=1 Tax=Streptomyces tendae TaxID=1932 RepID=UPI0036654E88
MAQYLVTYLTGNSETIDVDNLEPSSNQYVGWDEGGAVVAYIPANNVRSIVRQDDEAVTD